MGNQCVKLYIIPLYSSWKISKILHRVLFWRARYIAASVCCALLHLSIKTRRDVSVCCSRWRTKTNFLRAALWSSVTLGGCFYTHTLVSL